MKRIPDKSVELKTTPINKGTITKLRSLLLHRALKTTPINKGTITQRTVARPIKWIKDYPDL